MKLLFVISRMHLFCSIIKRGFSRVGLLFAQIILQ